ncbi:UTP--glucose-1-phosphate uridylyltransferase GalU [Thalassospira mesophila]|uniref:UTP--glucose-1-phosphate uridylyltransferase n=1 Tax=Thalassospira mesophila TaxID=1293891 RepID=A0A1Y2KYH4_9PROT|nr:UTP--glucose-1-phosphate uridylyltransferase GalU [Thalassospira mesophila]OSQ37169.1 UTP--glucose-1-phosphate uridylyltransferase [Thalassospira mesophila]
MTKRIKKAVFPVAGMGTRFLPATKAMPKEMLPVVDKPLIQYAVEEAIAAGIEEFIFVTGRGKTAIEDHFDRSAELEAILLERGKHDALETALAMIPENGRVTYTRQGNPLGLGHAVLCAKSLVGDEPFVVLLADDLIQSKVPCMKQMVESYGRTGGNMVAVMDVPREETKRYGVLEVEGTNGRLVSAIGMVEKPDPKDAPSTLSAIGRYILDPGIFDVLESIPRGAGNEIQLTDALAAMIGKVPFYGYRFEGQRFDCGNKVGFLKATLAFALERPDLRDDMRALIKEFAELEAAK